MTSPGTPQLRAMLGRVQQLGYLIDTDARGSWDYAIVSPDGDRYWTLTLKRNGGLAYAMAWEAGNDHLAIENRRICSLAKLVDVERSVRRHAETLVSS